MWSRWMVALCHTLTLDKIKLLWFSLLSLLTFSFLFRDVVGWCWCHWDGQRGIGWRQRTRLFNCAWCTRKNILFFSFFFSTWAEIVPWKASWADLEPVHFAGAGAAPWQSLSWPVEFGALFTETPQWALVVGTSPVLSYTFLNSAERIKPLEVQNARAYQFGTGQEWGGFGIFLFFVKVKEARGVK